MLLPGRQPARSRPPNVVLYNPETDVRLSHVRPESWVPVDTSDASGIGTVECDLCDWTDDTRDWADALSAKADHYHQAHGQRVPIPLASCPPTPGKGRRRPSPHPPKETNR